MNRCVSNGGGSCPVCQGPLELTSVKLHGIWYCSPACAEGRKSTGPEPPRVPEPWLYARPRRFFRKRKPKELKAARAPR